MKIKRLYSPNFDQKKRTVKSIKILVYHYTGMQSEREAIIRLCKPTSKVSSHFLISRSGKVYGLVKENRSAWHAGNSCWGKYKNLNKNSIGIELVNKGHQFGYVSFTKKQILSLIQISKKLIKKYKIKKKNIVGHSDIAPLRKLDPGEKFPWQKLSINRIGIWNNCNRNLLQKYRGKNIFKRSEKIKFIKNLNKIGYRFIGSKIFAFKKTISSFQRRHRTQLINGILDKECMIIAENLSKKL